MQTRAHSSDHEISKPSSYDSPFEEMIREGSVELDRWRVNDRIVHVRFHDIFQRVALSLNNDTGMGATLGRIMYANVEVPDSCAIHRYSTALAVLTVLYCPFPYLSILPARDRRILEIFWVAMMRFFIRGATTLVFISQLARGFVMSAPRYGKVAARLTNRRDAIQRLAKIASPAALAAGVLVARPLESSAAQKINKPLGQEAFRRIRDARQILDRVDVPLRGRNFDEVQEILKDPASAKLDRALADLVQSNVLPSDDRRSVGTIRTYGLAADALISLGGLNAASRDGDGGEARRMLVLTKEAINDILTIGVNNDLNKK